MSSYRPPYRRFDREAEKREAERKAAEEERRRTEMNHTNFPELSTAHPVNQREALGGNQFAKLAQKWAIDAEVDRRMEEHKRFKQAVENQNMERIQARRSQQSRYARHDEEYEEELAPTPAAAAGGSALGDDVGWTEVKRKTRKPKRELTVEEMDERDRQREQAENSAEDFNGHLFDSNRHDHDRV